MPRSCGQAPQAVLIRSRAAPIPPGEKPASPEAGLGSSARGVEAPWLLRTKADQPPGSFLRVTLARSESVEIEIREINLWRRWRWREGPVFAVGLQARLPWPLSWRPCGGSPAVAAGWAGDRGDRRRIQESPKPDPLSALDTGSEKPRSTGPGACVALGMRARAPGHTRDTGCFQPPRHPGLCPGR